MMNKGQFTGEVISDYRVKEKLGQGGMAETYKAHETYPRDFKYKVVAIKLLPQGLNDDEAVELFKREATAHRELEHSNIIQFLDFGFQEVKGRKVPFIAMEYAPLGSLDDLIKKQDTLPLDQSVDLLLQIADGLEYAHSRGILHRDIKPANILLCAAYRRISFNDYLRGKIQSKHLIAKLADFGIFTDAHNLDSLIWEIDTFTGPIIAGTLSYMSPEQIKGNPRIPSDIYSLAVTAYKLFTGELPLNGQPLALLQIPIPRFNQTSIEVTSPLEAVEEVVVKALDKDPKRRHQSAREFHDDLERIYILAKEKEVLHRRVIDMQDRVEQRLRMIREEAEEIQSYYYEQRFTWQEQGEAIKELISECDRLIEIMPNNPSAYLAKAHILSTWLGPDYSEFGQGEEELGLFDKAISLDPRNPKAYEEKGDFLAMLISQLDNRLVSFKYFNDSRILSKKIDEFSKRGEYEQIVTFCDHELKNEELSYLRNDFLDYKARALMSLGRYEEAEMIYNLMIKEHPKSDIGYLGKAKVLEKFKERK